jgi:hypothetical protein
MEVEAKPVEQTEAQKIWQEYLQKCCEVGQLFHAVDQLESQKAQIEKNLEVTQRAVKSLAQKHRDNQAQGLVPKPEPTPETATQGTEH